MIKVEKPVREFLFEKKVLADVNPALTAEEIASFYSTSYPELVTCIVSDPKEQDGKLVYEFKKNAGTKG